MKRLTPLVALAALALSGAGAKAESVIYWTYSWDRTPITVEAGSGGINLTNEIEPRKGGNGSDIVATNLSVFSSALPETPDVLGPNSVYTLNLSLTDDAAAAAGDPAATGTFTFMGRLSGSFSKASSNVTNSFDVDAANYPVTQKKQLGNNLYEVTIGQYAPPGPFESKNQGSISAHVKVTPVDGGGNTPPVVIKETPEPSTLLLSALGLSAAGFAGWRHRRRATALPVAVA